MDDNDSFALIRRLGRDDPLAELELTFLSQLEGVHELTGLEIEQRGIHQFVRRLGPHAERNANDLVRFGKDLYEEQSPLASGSFQLALRHYVSLEGSDGLRSLRCAHMLARALRLVGEFKSALDLSTEAFGGQKRLLGEQHEDVLEAVNDLAVFLTDMSRADEAIELLKPAWAASVAVRGEFHRQTLTVKSNLGDAYRYLGAFEEACRIEEEVLQARRHHLGEHHVDTFNSMNNLGHTLLEQGRLVHARQVQEELLELRRLHMPADDIDTVTAMANLAVTLYRQGQWTEALTLERQVLVDRERLQGKLHPDTLTARNNIAGTYRDLGDTAEARVHLEEVLDLRREDLGREHDETLMGQLNLGDLLCKMGELKEARLLCEEAHEIRERIHGAEHPATLTAKASLAAVLFDQGERAAALNLQQFVTKHRVERLGDEHHDTLLARNDLGNMLLRAGERAAALSLYEAVLPISARMLGTHHGDTLAVKINLAELLYELGRSETALLHGMQIAEFLADRTLFFGDDYKLAVRAFSLLRVVQIPENLRELYSRVSGKMCASIELRTRDSVRLLLGPFREFHAGWQSFCVDHDADLLPIALVATQGLEAMALADSALIEAPLVSATRALLSEVRARLEQTDAELSSVESALVRRPNSIQFTSMQQSLQSQRRQCVLEERAAVRAYEEAVNELALSAPELAGVLRVPRRTTRELALPLANDEALILLWRQEEATVASVIFRSKCDSVLLPKFESLLTMAARYESGINASSRGWRRQHTQDAEASTPSQEGVQDTVSEAPIDGLKLVCQEVFWSRLRNRFPEAHRWVIVADPSLHSAPLEVGNPGLEARYFTGLPSLYRAARLPNDFRHPQPQDLVIVTDAAWNSRNPIPFVEVEARLTEALVPGSRVISSSLLQPPFEAPPSRLLVACHGTLVGIAPRRYPVLDIDSERGKYLDPVRIHSLARQLTEFYCAACVGGVVSQAAAGDALGIVSALQLRAVAAVVASPLPVPDFYMPLLSGLYWHARTEGQRPHEALAAAKRQLRSGDWPQVLHSLVRDAYADQMASVLHRFSTAAEDLKANAAALGALVPVITQWPWPADTGFEAHRPLLWNRSGYLKFSTDYCANPQIRQEMAARIAGHLVAERHVLPREIVEHICAFTICYG